MKGETLQEPARQPDPAAAADGSWVVRGQALLGTIVQIGIRSADTAAAHAALARGFAAVREVERLMSFHDPASELSALNRTAFDATVRVSPHTWRVLALAREISMASQGIYDVTVAPLLVTDGELPSPPGAGAADPDANWEDVELQAGSRVRFRRRLWIDLGGIAKGYAVDLALERMQCGSRVSGYVNAGGDLRVCGPAILPVLLRAPGHCAKTSPVVALEDGSLASSSAARTRRPRGCGDSSSASASPSTAIVERPSFVTVVAQRCVVADALTKLVLAGCADAPELLTRFAAQAHCFEPRHGWNSIGAAP